MSDDRGKELLLNAERMRQEGVPIEEDDQTRMFDADRQWQRFEVDAEEGETWHTECICDGLEAGRVFREHIKALEARIAELEKPIVVKCQCGYEMDDCGEGRFECDDYDCGTNCVTIARTEPKVTTDA